VKVTINKIYEFITKLVWLLEDEIDELKNGNTKSTLSAQKNITNILNKLVGLISELNKISRETEFELNQEFDESDQEILSRFIERIKNGILKNNEE
jgi:phosphopantothenate synthetase